MTAAKRDRAAGFLLAETLATFTISAFVLVALASVAPILVRSIDRSVSNLQDVDDLARTLGSLQRDIAELARARWNGAEPQSFVFRGSANSLFFAHREPTGDGLSEVRVVALREILVEGGTRLVHSEARLPATARTFEDLRFGPQQTLETGQARLRFWYIPVRKPGEGEPQRTASWPIGPRLPASIVIEAISPATKAVLVTARVPIRTNADIGCLLANSGTQQQAIPSINASADQGGPVNTADTAFNAARYLAGAQGASSVEAPAAGAPDAPSAFCGRDDLEKSGSDVLVGLSGAK